MARTTPRIVIISDTHLGRPGNGAASADALRPLWIDADELIVNGDVAELHDARYRARAARHVLRLQQLCDADCVQLTLISGNHDPLLTDVRHLRLFDGTVFITHGDVIHPAISPWNGTETELRAFNEEALAMLDAAQRESFLAKLAAAQHASLMHWDPLLQTHQGDALPRRFLRHARKVAATLWFWHVLPRTAAAFMDAHAPEAKFFIFGHIHRAGTWTIDGRIIINTGCFGFPIRPRAVVIERGTLSVWPVVATADECCTFGNTPLKRWPLPDAADKTTRSTERAA